MVKKLRRRRSERYRNIIRKFQEGKKQIEIAKEYNVSRQWISWLISEYKKGNLDYLFLSREDLAKKFLKEGLPAYLLRRKSKGEKQFIEFAKKKKYKILTNGFPDFLIKKGNKWIAVEVKDMTKQKLSIYQEIMRLFWKNIGVSYKIFVKEKGFEKLPQRR